MSGSSSEMVTAVRDDLLAAALCGGSTVVDAAEASGYSEATARRRLNDATFRARVDESRRELTTLASAQLAGKAERFIAILAELAEDKEQPGAVRRGACKDGLSALVDLGDGRDVVARLEVLEAAAAERAKGLRVA